jgi:hypothetical protein
VKSVEGEFTELRVEENGEITEIRKRISDFQLFDEAGRLIEDFSEGRAVCEEDEPRLKYLYDESGILIRKDKYDWDGEVHMGYSTFRYSEDGGHVEDSFYFADENKAELGHSTAFDEAGRIVSTVNFDSDGKPIEPGSYPQGSNETIEKTLPDGLRVEVKLFKPDGTYSHKTITEYDIAGRVVNYSAYEADGTMYLRHEYEYELDSYGNWTKQFNIYWVIGWGPFKLIPFTVTRRKIEYFK